jgi:hypothetical protein
MLASGLVENLSITHLNLSHNKIADRGVRALAKLLDGHSVIRLAGWRRLGPGVRQLRGGEGGLGGEGGRRGGLQRGQHSTAVPGD